MGCVCYLYSRLFYPDKIQQDYLSNNEKVS